MLKNYLKIAYRNLWKHKFYTGLNVFGLSIGLGCCMLLYQFISYHLSFDQYHKNSENIYRVVTDIHFPESTFNDPGAPIVLGRRLENDVSLIKGHGILLKNRSFNVAIENGKETRIFSEKENISFANPQWFQLFDHNWIRGNQNTALNSPNTAVITYKLSEKYFGDSSPIGKIIRLDNEHDVKITGLIDDYPANTDIKVDLFLSLTSVKHFYPDVEKQMTDSWNWVSSSTSLFVLAQPGARQAEIDNEIEKLTELHMGDMAQYYKFHLQPLEEVHFDGRYDGVIDKSLLVTLSIIGFFLITIAGFNFVNLSIAQSAKRAKEVGIRKVLGISKSGIFWQFMLETALVVFLALTLAFLWVNLFLPDLNQWLQINLSISFFYGWQSILILLFLLIILIIVAGFYPAVVLSRFSPVRSLKGIVNKVQTASMSRNVLLIGQNTIAQTLIICTLIITLQVNYFKDADLGFNKDAIVMVPIPEQNKDKMLYLKNELASNSNIVNSSFCFRAPSSDRADGGSIRLEDREWENFAARSCLGDVDYLKTFDLQLIAGRNMDESDTVKQFLVNEKLVEKFGFKDPEEIVGRVIVAGQFSDAEGTVVGVINDFHARSLHTPIEPLIISSKRDSYDFVAIKLNSNDLGKTIKEIEREWDKLYAGFVFEYEFLDEQIARAYKGEELLDKLIKSGAVIAIILSCFGLLGLVSLLTVHRTKEIGIRKILGSKVSAILLLLSKDFIVLLMIALIIASPISWFLMNIYLQDFAYHIDIEWWMFAIGGLLSLGIALLTISWKAINAALANPVDALRNE